MVLDPSAREANILDSLKKFFVDNIETASGYLVTFDTYFDTPKMINKNPPDRWVSFNVGPMDMGTLSDITVDLYLCARKDAEGFLLAQLRDTVMGYLSDTTQTDGMKRIPFYRSYADQPWTLLGAFLVQDVLEGERETAPDQTKYKQLTLMLKVASKV